ALPATQLCLCGRSSDGPGHHSTRQNPQHFRPEGLNGRLNILCLLARFPQAKSNKLIYGYPASVRWVWRCEIFPPDGTVAGPRLTQNQGHAVSRETVLRLTL